MGLKPDHWIKRTALEHQMIEPFVDRQVSEGVISYGLSSYGYDIRVADEFKIFQPEITANKLSDVQCDTRAFFDGKSLTLVFTGTT